MADPTWYCDGKVEGTYLYIVWSFAMYFSYFVLFANFFYHTYLAKGTRDRKGSGKGQEVTRGGAGATGVSTEVNIGLTKRKQFAKVNGAVTHKDP